MKVKSLIPLAVILACTKSVSPPPDDDLRLGCRVDVAPLRARLLASGGDRASIVGPSTVAELSELNSGSRYKFVLTTHRRLAIAPRPMTMEPNEYVHPILGDGAAVLSAGTIAVHHSGSQVERVVLDAQSREYCATDASLRPTVRALLALGLPASAITVRGRASVCVDDASERRYGPVMLAVGRRYEVLGAAIVAENWELAAYELHELREGLDELPEAALPERSPVDLAPFARAFPDAALPPLEHALQAHNLSAARAAYATVSRACNACHQTAGRPWILAPTTPGETVPLVSRSTEAPTEDTSVPTPVPVPVPVPVPTPVPTRPAAL